MRAGGARGTCPSRCKRDDRAEDRAARRASRRLLLVASVQGHEFDSAVVAEAAEMDPADVEERLERSSACTCSSRGGEEHEFPDRTLTLQLPVRPRALPERAVRVAAADAARVAEPALVKRAAVAPRGEAPAIAGRLALLFETARDFASSASYFLVAARKAMALFAFREALSLADRGLDGSKGLPVGAGADAAGARAADDARPGAPLGEGLGGPRAGNDVHARAATGARAAGTPRAVPGAVGPDASSTSSAATW